MTASIRISDQSYGVDAFRAGLAQRGIQAVIPARVRCLDPQPCDSEAYKARNAVERGFGWLKWWRRVAPATTNTPIVTI